MGEMDDIVKEFLVESSEGLDQLDRDLVMLEQHPGDRDLLARIFRCIHTVKGTCGFLGFGKLESVSHVGESLLSLLRDGARQLTQARADALLKLVDAIRAILTQIETTGEEGDGDYSALVATLTTLLDDDAPAATAPPVVKNMGEILVERGVVEPEQVAKAADQQAHGDPRRIGEILVEQAHVPPAAIVEALETQQETRAAAPTVSDTTVRVDVGLLDRLMNLVGELVLARNQILQHTAGADDQALTATSQRLNLVTTELQEGVMKTRMQPIGTVWSKFPRIVRDLAVQCKKQIRIDMEGQETELDRTIIEAIKDPLTHIIRNSVDHGIESPADRVAAGKTPEGRVLMRAFHEGGQVNIEIIDDGGGINPERIKAKAVQKGVLTADQAANLTEREALNLVFKPGFSTAEKVSNISGRGVGMDVVRTNIERIGGVVDITSVYGQGTTLRIKIPLTLAIVPGLIITTGGNRYAIPQVSLLELVRLEGDEANKVETIDGAPIYRLRGNLLPLLQLRHSLGSTVERWTGAVDDAVHIVVLHTDGVTFGLVVDEINDTEEIVVKPLGKHLKGVTAFAGATIMGDGRVALILDVFGIAQRGGVLADGRERREAEAAKAAADGGSKFVTLLLCEAGGGRRFAVPLSSVARLEEIPVASIETAGSREVVQYRDKIMPLVRLEQMLGLPAPEARDSGNVPVIVYGHEDKVVGLVVGQILDIVETQVQVDPTHGRNGILGSVVVQGKVTDLLDVRALAESAGLELAVDTASVLSV